jgi:hypothetical protein
MLCWCQVAMVHVDAAAFMAMVAVVQVHHAERRGLSAMHG